MTAILPLYTVKENLNQKYTKRVVMNLVPVSESPFNKNTAYKYHSLKKYPSILFKVAGKLMVDMDEYNRLAEQAREKQVRAAERVRSG